MRNGNLASLARQTIVRADRRNPIHPTEARTLALAYLEAIGEPVEHRPAVNEWERAIEGREDTGPNGRMGAAPIHVGGYTEEG